MQVRCDWREVRTYIGAGAFDLGRMKIGILAPSVAVMLCSKWSISYTLCHLILIVMQSRKRGSEWLTGFPDVAQLLGGGARAHT